MSARVELYVYDLSNGMASRLSRQLTGRQIDGIWHTSVVVFGREVFYGQGIMTAAPGRSHHGTPLRVIDMGETSLDEATWNEYLDDMREHYTADKYHLLDFNCNSFTNDCIGFLTGSAIPDFIKDLPADFLSTPFGAALRPTIDAMFRAPSASSTPTPAPRIPATQPVRPDPNPQLTASLLQAIANQAALPELPPSTSTSTSATQSLTGPIHLATNSASFHTLLRTHRAVVAFFTQQSCPPCRVIEPVFERLAHDTTNNNNTNGKGGLAFTKVDIGVGLGSALAQEFSVHATPTFIFFLDGQKVAEIKGADAGELKTQVDLLVWGAWPPHPHTSLSSRSLSFSLAPILFAQQPPLDALATKFSGFIDAYCEATSADSAWGLDDPDTGGNKVKALEDVHAAKAALTGRVVPFLKARAALLSNSNGASSNLALKIPIDPSMLAAFTRATEVLVGVLKVEELFPLVDIWRLALLDPRVGQFFATQNSQPLNPIGVFLAKTINSNDASSSPSMSRNYTLVLLRLLANAFASPEFSLLMMNSGGLRGAWTPLLVGALLHTDAGVRTAAASLAFNAGAYGLNRRSSAEEDGDGEWEVEMASALVEAIDREIVNEDVVHRLVAALASLLRLSPFHEQLGGLLEVLQAKDVLKRKLAAGNFGAGVGKGGVRKEEVRALIRDVADKLCP
ncbi:thioredoxin family protein [Pleurotus eryngii]|uniref:Thioredoxin family protein n=1 Tax=Pleurotus eryngii TaxID=5323 RepID=A0A9P5ZR08_PLEER|nr:thioredoxin family protein [Pleurotus eryngii]